MSHLDALLSPITVKGLEIPNRVVMPPMGSGLCNKDGTISDALLAYMKRQAASGAGLLISEITAVHPDGIVGQLELGAWDDRFIPGLAELAKVMHTFGAKAAMQLHHAGRESPYMLHKGRAVGPSAAPSLIFGKAPKEMTVNQIEEVVSAFASAAGRAKAAGFDAVELHGAHGYLLTQFLSAISNHRKDQYGGTFADRARFIIEVVRAVRREVGENFPISLRLSAEEYIKNGYTVEDVLTIVPDLVDAGVDILHASIGTHGSPAGITSAPPTFDVGFNVWRAEKIKEVTQIPVIAVGRFSDPRQADKVIARGQADLVAFGRQQLCDPDYLKKAKAGQFEDIRICIACNQGCIEREMFEGKSVRCAINPETGQELQYPDKKSDHPKQVWVIGAGPAGLTAALEAKRLGHDVTIFEKEAHPGGNILYACKAPHKEIYLTWIQFLIKQVETSGVSINTRTEVTAELLRKESPEAVIVATGGEKIIPGITGVSLPHVYDAWQILGESIKAGKKALVVGGGLIGMETACFLAERNCTVTLIEQMESSPVPKYTSHGYSLHKYLSGKDSKLIFGATLTDIGTEAVTVQINGAEQRLTGFDQIVLAVGMHPRNQLKAIIEEIGIQHTVVGDALQVRRIMEATEEGARAAWEL